jgi:hypothetical protein
VQFRLVLEQLSAIRRQVPNLLTDQPQSSADPRRFRAPQVQSRSLPDVLKPAQFSADLEVGRLLPPLFLDVLAEERNRQFTGR